jgi:hypothetical protein
VYSPSSINTKSGPSNEVLLIKYCKPPAKPLVITVPSTEEPSSINVIPPRSTETVASLQQSS